jgi:hypothetical protein
MVDRPDPQKHARRQRQRERERETLKADPLLYNLIEALWHSKQRECEMETRLESGQGHPADWKGDETSDAADSLHIASEAISELSAAIAEFIFKQNGWTGSPPWLAFTILIGEPPFKYIVSVEPGRVLVGEYRISSYLPEHARVIVAPSKRLFKLELAKTPKPTPQTQDDPA